MPTACPPACACRYRDVLPYDDNRVRLGRPAFPPGWASSSSAALADSGGATTPLAGGGAGRGSASSRGSSAAAEGDLEDYVNASPLFSCTGGDGSGACFDEERWAYIASQVGAQQHVHAQGAWGSLQVVKRRLAAAGQSIRTQSQQRRPFHALPVSSRLCPASRPTEIRHAEVCLPSAALLTTTSPRAASS